MKLHSTIKRLSNDVINQIKAGEVIERPLNVVKELVENSIDASATKITIELLDGGKKLIQVSDNGVGIPQEQLEFATERHTTSKLQTFEDLYSLDSFGFRGEALASILSISQFSIKSKTQESVIGTEICFNRQDTSSGYNREVVMNQGTTIAVKDLFYNVPARLKFLRSTATEFALIAEFLRAISLALPNISFELIHNGRQVFAYSRKSTLKERFYEIFGQESQDYVEVDFSHGHFQIKGFTILPTKITSAQSIVTTFVNQRFVKDRLIRSSVYSGYQGLLMKGLKPSASLFITLDSKYVDINAHPAKIEVRFLDPLMIQDLITRSIENAVKTEINTNLSTTISAQNRNSHQTFSQFNQFVSPKVAHFQESRQELRFPNIAKLKYSPPIADTVNVIEKSYIPKPVLSKPALSQTSLQPIFQKDFDKNIFSNSEFLGQFLKCYLLFEKQEELWIVDQHAFHERVLFEEYQDSLTQNSIQKQVFLNPTIIDINPHFQHVYEENYTLIHRLGFEIEILKNKTLAIHSGPIFLNLKYLEPLFLQLSEKIFNQERTTATELYHDYCATMACHHAIRAGEPLSKEFVIKLMNRAKDVDFFAHCPHGRPVIRKFSKNDVERWFERI